MNSSIGAIALILAALIALLNVGLFVINKTRPFIHDALASTVCVDMASQMIFNSVEEMIEYKKRIHREEAENAKYLD